jgi:hypothetical protein
MGSKDTTDVAIDCKIPGSGQVLTLVEFGHYFGNCTWNARADRCDACRIKQAVIGYRFYNKTYLLGFQQVLLNKEGTMSKYWPPLTAKNADGPSSIYLYSAKAFLKNVDISLKNHRIIALLGYIPAGEATLTRP